MPTRKPTGYLFAILALCALTGIVWADYTVKADDTLTSISQSQLGSTAHWKEIAQLNNIKHPHSLIVGQTLKMPGDNFTTHTKTNNNPPPSTIIHENKNNSSQLDSPASKPSLDFNLQALLFKLTSTWGSLLKAGIFFYIVYAITVTGLWAVSMRLNCNIMILPQKVPFGQCLKLAVIHLLLAIVYVFGCGLVFLLPNNPILSTAIVISFVIMIAALTIFATKKIINTGWFWALLFLFFSHTVASLLIFALLLAIILVTLSITAIIAIF